MTYTVSHRQAGVQRSDVAGLIRHEYRDVDKSNGKETEHANERIVPSRTAMNQSMMWVEGEQVELTDSRQILDELDRRLAGAGGTRTNKKTGAVTRVGVRSDAKVVRNIVLQLDPVFTRSSEYLVSDDCPDEHADAVMAHMQEMVQHYADLYGEENLLAASVHLDETSPHIHLMVTPIDDEGRVRNASFIADGRGPKSAMARNDKAMRQRLAAAGYDVDPEPRGLNRSHMTIDEYAQHQLHEEQLKAREIEVEDREMRLSGRESALEGREAVVGTRERNVSQKASEAAQSLEQARRVAEAAMKAQEAAEEQSESAEAARAAAEESKRRFETALSAAHRSQSAARELAEAFRGVPLPKEKAAQVNVKMVEEREARVMLRNVVDDVNDRDSGPSLG